jgi:raffinose/stachyose/melibiose transport system permease protein
MVWRRPAAVDAPMADRAVPPLSIATAQHGVARATRRRVVLLPYLFLLPALIFAGVFLYYPALSALEHSVFDWDGFTAGTFNGLDNFATMLGDPLMQRATLNVLKLTGFALVIELTVPLLVAKLIMGLRSPRWQHVFRVLFVVPLVVPTVVIYLMWAFIYDPNIGLINQVLGALHLTGLQQDWLGDPTLALYSIMFLGFPWVDGFALLIYTAGLQAIPGEVLEAAAIDGCGGWGRFLRVELPLLLGQLRLILVLTIINGIQQFTVVLILTGGGPANATMVPGLYLYLSAFDYGRFGYACAIGAVLFIIIMGFTAVNLTLLRPSVEFDAERAA